MKNTVLFDLDGTVLPMDNEYFTHYYLNLLGKKFLELGYDAEASIQGVWNGLKHMVKNYGSLSNEQAFWNGFSAIMEQKMKHSKEELNTLLLSFYQSEFHEAKVATSPNDVAAEIVHGVKALGKKVVLATNPIFPKQAVLTRLSWIGLTEDDFDYITTYENSHYCKPNPAYYEEICKECNISQADCVMIGNDVSEDMIPAASLQMKTFLVKDHQIGDDGVVDTEKGLLKDVLEWLKKQ